MKQNSGSPYSSQQFLRQFEANGSNLSGKCLIRVRLDGTRMYYNEDGLLHRDSSVGPAIEAPDGSGPCYMFGVIDSRYTYESVVVSPSELEFTSAAQAPQGASKKALSPFLSHDERVLQEALDKERRTKRDVTFTPNGLNGSNPVTVVQRINPGSRMSPSNAYSDGFKHGSKPVPVSILNPKFAETRKSANAILADLRKAQSQNVVDQMESDEKKPLPRTVLEDAAFMLKRKFGKSK